MKCRVCQIMLHSRDRIFECQRTGQLMHRRCIIKHRMVEKAVSGKVGHYAPIPWKEVEERKV